LNLDQSIGESSSAGRIVAHQVNIDWSDLEGSKPFASYPVEQRSQLVGRDHELSILEKAFRRRPLSNLYVVGQRRVGKTSLIRVLTNELRRGAPGLHVAIVEAGAFRDKTGPTIGALGRGLAERLIRSVDLKDEVAMPDFDQSLAPLTEVVEQILEWDSELNILFVIDEFDEIPPEAYRRGGPGDAMFLPIRSLAQKPNVGWLLVGGEKMQFVQDEQSVRLNTFDDIRLDYLQATGNHGSGLALGFADLVRQPLPEGFMIEDAAVRSVFRESAGNPHFAKAICTVFFSRAVSNRDAVITDSEIEEANALAARENNVELFAHFWEDGIFGTDEEVRRAELERREFLTGLAQLLRMGAPLTQDRLRQAALDRGVETHNGDRLRTEFVQRGILEDRGEQFDIHVPLFKRWLEAEGIYKLPPKGIAAETSRQMGQLDKELRVTSEEVRKLVRRWEKFEYKGQRRSRDDVEHWLEQFDLPQERRLAFRFLERLQVLTDDQIYKGLRSLQRIVAHDASLRLKQGQRVLSHLYVSPVGAPGSSGNAYAYTYRQANNIRTNNVVEPGRLIDLLLNRHDIKAVVLIDDFVGSGQTAIKAIELLAKRVDELRARPEVSWFLFAVTGLENATSAIAESAPGRKLGLRVEFAHPLLAASLPLDGDSTVFAAEEREQFRTLLTKYGKRISARRPLGFGEFAAPVVLPDNCPNNAPPILWSDGGNWKPLFPRTPS
jgi:hypothetical protein